MNTDFLVQPGRNADGRYGGMGAWRHGGMEVRKKVAPGGVSYYICHAEVLRNFKFINLNKIHHEEYPLFNLCYAPDYPCQGANFHPNDG